MVDVQTLGREIKILFVSVDPLIWSSKHFTPRERYLRAVSTFQVKCAACFSTFYSKDDFEIWEGMCGINKESLQLDRKRINHKALFAQAALVKKWVVLWYSGGPSKLLRTLKSLKAIIRSNFTKVFWVVCSALGVKHLVETIRIKLDQKFPLERPRTVPSIHLESTDRLWNFYERRAARSRRKISFHRNVIKSGKVGEESTWWLIRKIRLRTNLLTFLGWNSYLTQCWKPFPFTFIDVSTRQFPTKWAV